AEVGLETTLNRPIVNTRDEPHSDPTRVRRLHVIIGDANLLEEATFLKLGTTSLLLAALEAEHRTGTAILPDLRLADPVAAVRARFRPRHVIVGDATLLQESTFLKLGAPSLLPAALEAEHRTATAIPPDSRLADPVAAVRAISHDPSLRTTVELADGRHLTAL